MITRKVFVEKIKDSLDSYFHRPQASQPMLKKSLKGNYNKAFTI